MLKSDEILQKLEPDSKDVFVEGLIDTYTNRPDEMKNVCLANFASLYNVSKKKTDNAQITENSDDEDVIDNEIDEKTIALKMKNGKGWIKNRKKKKIIRYRNFKLHQDPENYYREQLMLFLPWINEEENLININHEETFELYKDLIQQKRSEYVHREANEFEQAFEDHTERENENDIDDKNIEYDEDKNEFLIYEIGNNEGSNPETNRAALCAPTGKAAALIDGMTLHSFLSLPVNQCKHKLVKLDNDISNRIGVKLKDLQLLIIDEISMVGFTMFQHVDARLQQIMRTKKPFGGISVIVLGDFNQLRPVGDKYIFQFNNSYNALVDNSL
ncbi:unnamed protein product [Rotaria socialis]|uniref:ATP-dependent DNA helicase n=1 Tax=Rotaria socialis TaxID=392032 RepID=A0A818BDV5_9BILA|nr:unnamed protein product [Rotaria socialis]